MTPNQREDIGRKYENIYRGVEKVVMKYLDARKGHDPWDIYMGLKPLVTGAWTLVLQGQLTNEEQQAFYIKLMNKPTAWTERGTPKKGTYLEYELSIATLYAQIWRDHAPSGCDLVVELGCGWGHRLIDMFLGGLDTRYVGGDRSDHSRNIVKAVTALFPPMKADWFRFDFLKPDFTALPDAKRILFLTCHAIEQVTVLGRDVFDAMIKRFPDAEIVGAHIEPISFQIDPTLTKEHAESTRKKYNTDLYAVVQSHPTLEITQLEPLLVNTGDGTASTLLIWKTKT